jgi:hypothetical protein
LLCADHFQLRWVPHDNATLTDDNRTFRMATAKQRQPTGEKMLLADRKFSRAEDGEQVFTWGVQLSKEQDANVFQFFLADCAQQAKSTNVFSAGLWSIQDDAMFDNGVQRGTYSQIFTPGVRLRFCLDLRRHKGETAAGTDAKKQGLSVCVLLPATSFLDCIWNHLVPSCSLRQSGKPATFRPRKRPPKAPVRRPTFTSF